MKKPIGGKELIEFVKSMPEGQKQLMTLCAFSGYAFAFDAMKSALIESPDQVYTAQEVHDYLIKLMPDNPNKMPADFLEIVLERMVNMVDNTSKD